MGTREYRLKNAADQMSEHEKESFKSVAQKLQQYQLSESEAVYFDDFIYLPEKQEIINPSHVKIQPVKKTRIDYIAKLENPELMAELEKLQKENDLKQGDLDKITKRINKLKKELDLQNNSVEKLKIEMKKYTGQVVNEKHIQKYVNNIKKNCNDLANCLFLENPEVLSSETKKELVNKINVVQTHIDDFGKQMTV